MTTSPNSSTSNKTKYIYNYANKCDCSDDDNCGCSFPNNMHHNFSSHQTSIEQQQEELHNTISKEKTEINTPNVHFKKEKICICNPKECECKIIHKEKIK